jgi:hypothetical protein
MFEMLPIACLIFVQYILKVKSIRPSDGNIAPGLFFRPTYE